MQKDININKIGFVGLGVMGMSMFKNLAKSKEFTVQGFDNDNSKLSTLQKLNLKFATQMKTFKNVGLLLEILLISVEKNIKKQN